MSSIVRRNTSPGQLAPEIHPRGLLKRSMMREGKSC